MLPFGQSVFLTCLRKQGTLPSVQCHPHMCFMDYDVQPTIDYFNWLVLGSNPEIEKLVNAEEEGLSNAYPQFDVQRASDFLFPLDHKYLAKISIYDKNYQAVFVLLGNASHELTGKHSSEMTASYRTLKSWSKCQNTTSQVIKTQTITLMKIVSAVVLPPLTTPPELPLAAKSKMALPSASDVGVYIAEEGNKSTSNNVTLTLIYRSRETKKVISPLPATATSSPPVTATDADAVYDSSHHFKRPDDETVTLSLFDSQAVSFHKQLGELCGDPKVIVATNINPKLIGGRLFLNATSGTHVYFDKETNAGEVLFYQLVARDTGLPSAAPLLRGYAKVEPLKIAELNNFIVTAPTQEIDFLCAGRVARVDADKGWCYVACSKCSRKLQRTVSAFTCVRCANPHAIEALRCPSLCCCVEMAIADDTAEGIFVWFDGVMTKLHNLRASEAGQMLVRVTAYNFTEHHKTFTITHIVDEIDRVPLLDVADDWDDGDDDDDKPAAKPLPVEVQSGGVSGNAHKKTVDSTSNVFKKARVA
ncbi:unnamed protein product [Brassica oleracea]